MLFAQRRMHPPFQLLPQFLQLADQASALGFAVDHEPPVQGLSAIVREAQEIERLWPPFAPSPTVRHSEPSELDQPRLVFVHGLSVERIGVLKAVYPAVWGVPQTAG